MGNQAPTSRLLDGDRGTLHHPKLSSVEELKHLLERNGIGYEPKYLV